MNEQFIILFHLAMDVYSKCQMWFNATSKETKKGQEKLRERTKMIWSLPNCTNNEREKSKDKAMMKDSNKLNFALNNVRYHQSVPRCVHCFYNTFLRLPAKMLAMKMSFFQFPFSIYSRIVCFLSFYSSPLQRFHFYAGKLIFVTLHSFTKHLINSFALEVVYHVDDKIFSRGFCSPIRSKSARKYI